MDTLSRLCVTIARLALPFWVGAATLFVINGIRLVTSPAFDSAARDQIALTRFPAYYVVGFAAVGMTFFSLIVAKGVGRRRRVVLALTGAALALMLIDYFAVYRPLEIMITPPGTPRTPRFETFHFASEVINFAHVGLCLLAAIVLNRPRASAAADELPS